MDLLHKKCVFFLRPTAQSIRFMPTIPPSRTGQFVRNNDPVFPISVHARFEIPIIGHSKNQQQIFGFHVIALIQLYFNIGDTVISRQYLLFIRHHKIHPSLSRTLICQVLNTKHPILIRKISDTIQFQFHRTCRQRLVVSKREYRTVFCSFFKLDKVIRRIVRHLHFRTGTQGPKNSHQ